MKIMTRMMPCYGKALWDYSGFSWEFLTDMHPHNGFTIMISKTDGDDDGDGDDDDDDGDNDNDDV